MVEHVDVAIVGAGGAGYPGAFLLDKAGLRVMMADPVGNLGGNCLAEGCVPPKAVREAALAYQRARHGVLSGVLGLPGGFDMPDSPAEATWRAALKHKDAVQQLRYEQHRREIDASGVHFVAGEVQVLSASELEVADATKGTYRFRFEHLVLATGSAPTRLPVPGAELALTSHELFRLGADLDLPERPIIIGGGYIGVEVASILAHLGAYPRLIELTDQLLPGFDRDLAKFLERSLSRRAGLYLGKAVTAIERAGSDFCVRYADATEAGSGAKLSTARGDLVVMATGRAPVLPPGVEHLELDLEGGAPKVDARLRTSRPSVWAPGDVNAKSMLFHSAVRQSTVVAHNILAGDGVFDRMDFSSVPVTVFSDPELAAVGLTEAQAAERFGEVAVGAYDYAVDSRAQIFGETDGYIKLVFDAHTAKLLGAQVGGLDAAQLISPLALALQAGLGARALAEATFPHPMVAEGINKAARQVLA